MSRFNEAAGFTRRKPDLDELVQAGRYSRFNEAAGFTRRKPLPTEPMAGAAKTASMRPPDLPGGNVWAEVSGTQGSRFNEAAGFTRRKLRGYSEQAAWGETASMRPPDLPGGNPAA